MKKGTIITLIIIVTIFVIATHYNIQKNIQIQYTNTISLKLGQVGVTASGITITPLTLVSDSRCPTGYDCVVAGDVIVTAQLSAGVEYNSAYTYRFSERKPVATKFGTTTLLYVDPKSPELTPTDPNKYIFTFSIEPSTRPSK